MTAQHAGLALYCVLCIFGAAVVCGYSGFGFSMLWATSLSIFLAPREVIAPLFILEVASLQRLRQVWTEIHWQSTLWLFAGCLLGTPLGVHAL